MRHSTLRATLEDTAIRAAKRRVVDLAASVADVMRPRQSTLGLSWTVCYGCGMRWRASEGESHRTDCVWIAATKVLTPNVGIERRAPLARPLE